MTKAVTENIPSCEVCGKKLWYNYTLKDGTEEWVCPHRWTGPDLLKLKPKAPDWEKHTAVIRPYQLKDVEAMSNWPETLRVKDYLQKGLPSLFKPK